MLKQLGKTWIILYMVVLTLLTLVRDKKLQEKIDFLCIYKYQDKVGRKFPKMRACSKGAKNYAGIDCFADKCSKRECKMHLHCTNCKIQQWFIHHKVKYICDDENDIVGKGIQATRRILKNQIIHAQMLIHPVPAKDALGDRYYVRHCQNLFALDEFGSTINHSCNPNVVMEKWDIPSHKVAIVFRASKEIRSQTFLHFDYNCDVLSCLGNIVCACMRSSCRLFIGVDVIEPPKWKSRNTKCNVVSCLKRSQFSGKCRIHSMCKECGRWKSNKSKTNCRECQYKLDH